MKGLELTAEILSWLHILRSRPYMVIPVNPGAGLPYELLAIYVEGYLAGIGTATGKSLSTNIHRWHERQSGEATPTPWHTHIRLLHKEAADQELSNLLLDDIETYFKQNPNWQEEEDIPLRIWFDDMEDERKL